ncbi:MAG: hypothetical protein HQ511_13535, partial [Rhodospirillales bacterium]|nr:hypothetical protein [Rhodospirillales bacterium]
IKGLNDLTDQLDDIAKGAGTTPRERWEDFKRNTPNPPPPYALPPLVWTSPGPLLNGTLIWAEAKVLYRNLSPWGFLIKEVFLEVPHNTPASAFTFVGPDRGMNKRRLARKAVDVRIALEEQVDFPNNLTPEQLARVRAADPTGEKTARARARQAGNIAAQEQAAEAHVIAFERIRKDVVALVTAENALDEISASDSDLFTFLYNAMTERAEANDQVFTHADLKDLWSFILDDLVLPIGGLKVIIVLGLVRAALGETETPKGRAAEPPTLGFKGLWNALLEQMRVAGPARIDQRGFVAHNGPSPAKSPWDRLVAATRDLKREIQDANIAFGRRVGIIDDPKFAPDEPSLSVEFWDWVHTTLKDTNDDAKRSGGPTFSQPSRFGEHPVDQAARVALLTDDEIKDGTPLITALKRIKIPPGLGKDAIALSLYEEAMNTYFKSKFTDFKRSVRGVTDLTKRRQIFADLTDEVIRFQSRQLPEARRAGTAIGKHIAQILSSDSERFQKQYDGILKAVAGDTKKPFSALSARQQAEVTERMVLLLPDMKQVSRAAKALRLASKAEKTLFGLTVATTVFRVATARHTQREFTAQTAVVTLDIACSHVARWGARLGLNRVGNKANPQRVAILSVAMAAWALCSYFTEQEIMEIFGPDGSIWIVPGNEGLSAN